MGKGDRKTAKGKRYNSSYGNARSHATAKATGTTGAPVVKKAAGKTVAKAPAKKAVAKKAVAKPE
ncbi:30S ribosomal protein S31 [Luteimonas cucumeris]|uniref:30S ribosomal protein S31 n=1 Tax=Luteimonas cucumeris TaxID=985012 RepID=A0A562L000_9GAMM|nr:30S ribosomal protein S31 [Luteimonas cucumeris]